MKPETATFRIVPYTKQTDDVDFGEEPIYFENFARNVREDLDETGNNSRHKSEETATFRILPYTRQTTKFNFGEEPTYFENFARNSRDNHEDLISNQPLKVSIPSTKMKQEYKYNILVLPKDVSHLRKNRKTFFESEVDKKVPRISENRIDANDYELPEFREIEHILSNNDETFGGIGKEIDFGFDNRLHNAHNFGNQPHPTTYDTEYSHINVGQEKEKSLLIDRYKDSHEQPISYSYNYNVNDSPYGPQFSKQEHSDGYLTRGEYSVKLPDGRTQTVTYSVQGAGGFSVNVHYTGTVLNLQSIHSWIKYFDLRFTKPTVTT